ncbi:PAS domain-containing protein, partial [Flavobacterium sp. UBA6046]|uniref:PAS domain-containing protein n=1 Tax=Flavobacterium sp. UBA6046 TaxID=1946552 RepID=UPI0025C3DD88
MLKLIQELKEQRNELESQNKVLQIEKQSLSNILEGTHQDITDCKLAEENSRLSKTTYRGILNSITELIYIQDENGCFLDVNEATEKIYGYNRESFIGKTPEFLSAPGKNDLDKITKVIQLAWKGIAQSFEFWGITRDGRIFPKEVNLSLGTFFGK